MTETHLKKETKLVQSYRRSLLALLERCKDIAEPMGLAFRHDEDTSAAFGFQQTDDEPLRVTLPRWEISSQELRVKFEPDEIQQDTVTGLHTGMVWVNRSRDGGRIDSPTVWTSLEGTEDLEIMWYDGARNNRSRPVTDETIRRWLTVSGPRPNV